MANTTFSGPIRSENNVQLISKTASTGVVHDRTQCFGLHDARRYYLDEAFYQRPGLNAINIIDPDADNASALAITQAANKNFETLGTNMTTALTTFPGTQAGILMTTAGADQDQSILLPHLDTNQSAWSKVLWGTENQVEWECSISLPALDNQKVWAGLKLTNEEGPTLTVKLVVLEDMIGRATCLDAGSVARGYVLVDWLLSIEQVNDNAPSLILTLSFSTVTPSVRAEANVCV